MFPSSGRGLVEILKLHRLPVRDVLQDSTGGLASAWSNVKDEVAVEGFVGDAWAVLGARRESVGFRTAVNVVAVLPGEPPDAWSRLAARKDVSSLAGLPSSLRRTRE